MPAVRFYLFSHGFRALSRIKSHLQTGRYLQPYMVLESGSEKINKPVKHGLLAKESHVEEEFNSLLSLLLFLFFFYSPKSSHVFLPSLFTKLWYLKVFFSPSSSLQHVQGFTKLGLFSDAATIGSTCNRTFLDLKTENFLIREIKIKWNWTDVNFKNHSAYKNLSPFSIISYRYLLNSIMKKKNDWCFIYR